MPDSQVSACSECNLPFNPFIRRRHHCRACGNVFCDECTADRVTMPSLGYTTPQRVCHECASGNTRLPITALARTGYHPSWRAGPGD